MLICSWDSCCFWTALIGMREPLCLAPIVKGGWEWRLQVMSKRITVALFSDSRFIWGVHHACCTLWRRGSMASVNGHCCLTQHLLPPFSRRYILPSLSIFLQNLNWVWWAESLWHLRTVFAEGTKVYHPLHDVLSSTSGSPWGSLGWGKGSCGLEGSVSTRGCMETVLNSFSLF